MSYLSHTLPGPVEELVAVAAGVAIEKWKVFPPSFTVVVVVPPPPALAPADAGGGGGGGTGGVGLCANFAFRAGGLLSPISSSICFAIFPIISSLIFLSVGLFSFISEMAVNFATRASMLPEGLGSHVAKSPAIFLFWMGFIADFSLISSVVGRSSFSSSSSSELCCSSSDSENSLSSAFLSFRSFGSHTRP